MKILEFFTGFITVFENPIYDLIFGGVLVSIAGSIAYWIGGKLEYSGKIGFILWLITAIVVYALIACMIRFIMWLITIPWWVWIIVSALSLIAVIACIIISKRGKKQ